MRKFAWTKPDLTVVRENEGRYQENKHLTRVETGTIPTIVAVQLAGKKGERHEWHTRGGERYFGNYPEERWNAFVEDIRERGIVEPVFIVVEWVGDRPKAFVYEGNHRIAAAVQADIDDIPVEVRYWGHAEDDWSWPSRHLQRKASSGDWYYRLSSMGAKFPISWSYGFEEDAVPGFQVWIHPWQVLSAILGYDMDGTYSPQDGYKDLILVRAADVRDSVDPWYAVLPEDVLETRIADTSSIQRHLTERLEAELGEDWDYDAQEYLEERDDELHDWLLQISKPTTVEFVDTLPKTAALSSREADRARQRGDFVRCDSDGVSWLGTILSPVDDRGFVTLDVVGYKNRGDARWRLKLCDPMTAHIDDLVWEASGATVAKAVRKKVAAMIARAAAPVRIRYLSYPQKEDYPLEYWENFPEAWEEHKAKPPSPTVDVEGLHGYVGKLKRPGHYYRGMAEEEWNYINQTGQVLSDCRYSLPTEGTCFAADPLDAEDYANYGRDSPFATGRPTYIVEVADREDMYCDTDDYQKCRSAIPSSAITRAWMSYLDGDDLFIKEVSPPQQKNARTSTEDNRNMGIEKYRSNKLFLAASKHLPKGWCYDHIGFVDQDTGAFVQMSGHRHEEGVFTLQRLTEDEEIEEDKYDIVQLPKTVEFTNDSLGAVNCVTFVVAVLRSNGITQWGRDYFHEIFKCQKYKKAASHSCPVRSKLPEELRLQGPSPGENRTDYLMRLLSGSARKARRVMKTTAKKKEKSFTITRKCLCDAYGLPCTGGSPVEFKRTKEGWKVDGQLSPMDDAEVKRLYESCQKQACVTAANETEPYTVENKKLDIRTTARDEEEATDEATILAEQYPGHGFSIKHLGKHVQTITWERGGFSFREAAARKKRIASELGEAIDFLISLDRGPAVWSAAEAIVDDYFEFDYVGEYGVDYYKALDGSGYASVDDDTIGFYKNDGTEVVHVSPTGVWRP